MRTKKTIAAITAAMSLSQVAQATSSQDVHFRYNLAGYSPERPKNIVIMTDKDLHATDSNPVWVLKKAGVQIATGEITPLMKVADKSAHHSPMEYSFHLDLRSQANTPGDYELTIEGETHGEEKASFKVKEDPYGDIVAEMLVHISSRRSGVASPIKQYREAMQNALTYSLEDGPKLGVLEATETLTDAQKALAIKPHYFDETGALPVYKLLDVDIDHPNYVAEKTEKNKVGNALWAEDPSIASFDISGGWYDAGDYIKFTLTIAHAAYYMLRAYETNSDLFDRHTLASSVHYDGYNGIILSGSEATGREAPIILDEAKFGLDFLARTYDTSRPDEFVVQVGDQRDHLNEDLNNEGKRLPIFDGTRHLLADPQDARDITDKRPILSALSPGHMGLTLAALSLGAKVFEEAGYTEDANRYKAKAEAIYNRLFVANTQTGQTKPGVLIANAFSYETATGLDAVTDGTVVGAGCVDFSYVRMEKSNITNNFYNDSVYCAPELPGLYRRKDSINQKSTYDNLGLGAIEYYRINTDQSDVLENASWLADKAGIAGWASWSNVNISLHYRLAELNQANNKFKSEIDSFRRYSDRAGSGLDSSNNVFGLPQQIVWSSLGNHLIAAPYAALGALLDNAGDTAASIADKKSNMLYGVLDYTLGRNNWGFSMVHTDKVAPEDRLKKYYNWIYTKLGLPTVGAVSQGPASRSDYQSQETNGMTPVSADEKAKRDPFNTAGAVFYEYSSNWVNMEAMGYQQAAALYTWAVATKLEGKSNSSGGGNATGKPTLTWSTSVPGTVLVGKEQSFNVLASDADGDLTSVSFKVSQGGLQLSSFIDTDVSDSQFSFNWTADATGSYTITATAIDEEGQSRAISSDFKVTDLDVQLSIATSASSVEADEQITITANLSGQSANEVDYVKLFVNGAATGPEDSSAPFEFAHVISVAGNYTLQIKGYDANNNEVVQSANINVTVNAIDGGGTGDVPQCSALGLSLNPSDAGGIVANTYNKKGVWHRKPWPGADNYDHASVGDQMLDGEFVYKVIQGAWVGLVPTDPQYTEYWNQWEKVCKH